METPHSTWPAGPFPEIDRVLVSRQEIAERVAVLGREIADCYAGQELTIVAVLTGSLIFLADLVRELPLRMELDLVSISSYPGEATTSQGPRFQLPLTHDLSGRHVLIVDDILDSGQTLAALMSVIEPMGPTSVRTCMMLDKDRPDLPDRRKADFVGFAIPNEFVVGYGLDFNHLYRNLPHICVLREDRMGGGA